jgi:hypothetical protein
MSTGTFPNLSRGITLRLTVQCDACGREDWIEDTRYLIIDWPDAYKNLVSELCGLRDWHHEAGRFWCEDCAPIDEEQEAADELADYLHDERMLGL